MVIDICDSLGAFKGSTETPASTTMNAFVKNKHSRICGCPCTAAQAISAVHSEAIVACPELDGAAQQVCSNGEPFAGQRTISCLASSLVLSGQSTSCAGLRRRDWALAGHREWGENLRHINYITVNYSAPHTASARRSLSHLQRLSLPLLSHQC